MQPGASVHVALLDDWMKHLAADPSIQGHSSVRLACGLLPSCYISHAASAKMAFKHGSATCDIEWLST